MVNGQLVGFFFDAVQPEDVARFGITIGDDKARQILEALAALVALRIWLPLWKDERIELTVRTDNTTELAMVSRVKASTKELQIIAAYMALSLGDSAYMPWVAEHTPGIQHIVADVLSRIHEAGKEQPLPAALKYAKICIPQRRYDSWYRSLVAP